MVSKNKQIALWLAWLLIWPSALVAIYYTLPTYGNGQLIEILSFGLMMSIVAFFPLLVGNTPIFFVHGIGFAVFLSFGLFIEVVLTQIAVLVLLLAKLRIQRNELFRVPINMLMFLFVSIFSASVYRLLGGTIGATSFSLLQQYIPILGYIVTVFISNHLLLYCLRRFVFNEEIRIFNKGLAWEFFTTLLVVPVGYIQYMMYRHFGLFGIYFVGLPYISISVILMLYHSSNRVNYYLQETSEIGHQLTAQLRIDEAVDLFVERVTKLLPVDYTYVFEVIDDDTLKLARFFDAEQKVDFPIKDKLKKFESVSGTVWGNNQGIRYQTRKQWEHDKSDRSPEIGESIMSIPVERNNKVVAVITLVSKKKRAFEKYQYMILDILVNHFAVALENAKNYEEAKNKSETDQLTGLFNFLYFEDYVEKYFEQIKDANSREQVSLILLDLDHFKEINDTYGHQAGNEILQGLADRLTKVIGNKGIVARYGGEEFVILLPDTGKERCLKLAETIRKNIADEASTVTNHILDNNSPILVSVTASLGTATYPDNCESPLELVRHADRAMYLGAKQKGRNRVAAYEK